MSPENEGRCKETCESKDCYGSRLNTAYRKFLMALRVPIGLAGRGIFLWTLDIILVFRSRLVVHFFQVVLRVLQKRRIYL